MSGVRAFNWCWSCLIGQHRGRGHDGRYCECPCKTSSGEGGEGQ